MADVNLITAVEGAVNQGVAVAENPVLCGGEGRTTLPTVVADGQAVRTMHDKLGRQVITPHAPREQVVTNRIALTTVTETTLLAAGGVGVFIDLTSLILSNESATQVRVDIRSATASTTIVHSQSLAANGGGAVIPFPVALPQAAANNNWTAQLSAAVSTVYITAVGVKDK